MVRSEKEIIEAMASYIRRNPTAPIRKIYSCVKGSNARLLEQARKLSGAIPALQAKQDVKVKGGRTFEQFRKDHDVTLKIREGLKKLVDVYMSDNEFRDFCGVHVSNWRRYADLDEFRDNRIRIQGIQYWAQGAFIKKMKNILGMVV